MVSYTLFFLPFHKKLTNIVFVSVLGASQFAAFVAYFSTLAGTSGISAVIALVIVIFPGAVAGNIFEKACLKLQECC